MKHMDDKLYWYWLASLNEFTIKGIEKILDEFTHPKEFFTASSKTIVSFLKDNIKKADIIITSRNEENIIKNYNKMCTSGIHFITAKDSEFPDKLKNIYSSPYWLFYIGSLPEVDKPSIAIVGARVCTNYGKDVAESLAYELSLAGIDVISGMATGIDGFAHWGAIKAGCRTYAILGTGPDICYPIENFMLYQKIINNGGVISEYPPKTAGKSFHFPMRNRIISGLADKIIVVEARKKSGSLITADYALEQGKDVYAVPGRINDKLSGGCLDLIWQGAKPIRDIYDIIEDFGIKTETDTNNKFNKGNNILNTDIKSKIYTSRCEKNKKSNILLETEEKIVYANLSLTPKHVETLLEETALPVDNLLAALLMLELKDLIIQPVKNYYALQNVI